MRSGNPKYLPIILAMVVLLFAGCGGGETATPAPTNTRVPTATRAATNTPVPTADPASLPVSDIQATVTALEEELANAQSQAEGASSASEEGAMTYKINLLESQLETLRGFLPEAAGSVVLVFAGDFAEARQWDWTELEMLEMMTATVEVPDEDMAATEYTGIGLVVLLEAAGLGDDATLLTVTSASGDPVEIDVSASKDCEQCMLVRDDSGKLALVMPGFDANFWVNDIQQIEAH